MEQMPSVSGSPLCKPETMQMELLVAGRGEPALGKEQLGAVAWVAFLHRLYKLLLGLLGTEVFCAFLLKVDILPLFRSLCS